MRSQPVAALDSGNGTIWDKYIDIAFVAANSLILFITSAVGLAANIFVILAVYNQKSLQTWNNAQVVNLAVVDILRCLVDCPLLLTIVLIVYPGGRVDELICDAQIASFSLTCCIQLLTLACISADRYQAIAQPFETSQKRRRIVVLIPLTWAFAVLVAVVCLLFLRDSPVLVKCKGSQAEASTYDTFGLYILFPIWAACFGVIIGFYARIFALVRSHNRKIFDKGTFPLSKNNNTEDEQKKQKKEETMAEEKDGHGQSEQIQNLSTSVELVSQADPNSSKKDSTAALLTSTKAPQSSSIGSENKRDLKNPGEITELDTGPAPPAVHTDKRPQSKLCPQADPSNRDSTSSTRTQKVSGNCSTEQQSNERGKTDKSSSQMKETSPDVPSSLRLDKPESTSVLLIEPKQPRSSDCGGTLSAAGDGVPSLPRPINNVPDTEAPKQSVEVEGAVCMMPSKANKDRARKKKESKLAKRAGYIIITYLLFWLPLIITILMNFIVHKNKNSQVSAINSRMYHTQLVRWRETPSYLIMLCNVM